ncbi:MAG: M23 family metallopeptidase [Cystobacterineae bacterium]|nr:M23 family metallopeptidase [Cystobacterineae bacterium]
MLGLTLWGCLAYLGWVLSPGEGEGVGRRGLEAKLGRVEAMQRSLAAEQLQADEVLRHWRRTYEENRRLLEQHEVQESQLGAKCKRLQNLMGKLGMQGAVALGAGQALGKWAVAGKRLSLLLRRCHEEARQLAQEGVRLGWEERRLLRLEESFSQAQAWRGEVAEGLHLHAIEWTNALTAALGGGEEAEGEGAGGEMGRWRGRLHPPLFGFVERPFGSTINPKSNTSTLHKGIRIRAARGSGVRAIAAGKVAYIGWLKGFGNLIIVEHAGGYHSLFGNLGEIFVGEGEEIRRGGWLGAIGEGEGEEAPGGGPGASLYFEIRRRGEAENPVEWFVHSSFR